jgi:RNA polymerase sigma-70 factor (ECF subfamily)
MRRVAANLCLNELARRRPAAVPLDEEADEVPADAQETPELIRDRSELAQRVRGALVRLPQTYRAVIELRHYQDMSYDDMAAALGIGVGDVRTRLFRARRLLARWLSDDA